jgi:predicted nucleic acid-binding protein
MINLIIDTNIVISALITPSGTLSKLIIRDMNNIGLYAPSFLLEEIENKKNKILKLTNLSMIDYSTISDILLRRITFIDKNLIEIKYQKEAYQIVKDIDPKDYIFLAFSLQTGFKIWTGDKKLYNGLKSKNFTNIINTNELLDILNK